VLIAIIVDPTAPVYPFEARRPPTRMPLALPLLQQLQCRGSGFVQSILWVHDLVWREQHQINWAMLAVILAFTVGIAAIGISIFLN
jgi:hypothetical protein